MTARPPDFEPLADADPVPGDPAAIDALGGRYAQTAWQIQHQADNLRRLAAGSRAGWKGQSGTVFASKAEDLATRIARAQTRYAAAAQALNRCAAPIQDAQQRAYAAVWKAKDATQRVQASAPVAATHQHPGNPAVTARAARHEEASADLVTARRQFDNAVHDYNAAADRAASAITAELNTDPLKDSWWDANFGWISHLFEAIAIAVIVLAVVALILTIPVTAGLLAALPLLTADGIAATATFIGGLLLALSIAQTVFDGIAMGTDKESWTAFAWDIFALATFGAGKGIEAGMKALAGKAMEVGKAVAASRAGRFVFRSRGLPGFLYSLAVRAPGWTVRLLGAHDVLAAATKAAEGAGSALKTAVKEAESSNLVTLLTMSDTAADKYAEIRAIEDEIPNVWRITAARSVAQALAVADGTLQWSAFGASGYFTLHSLLATGS